MSLRCSHDCLRGVDYLLYLFGRAFIALARPPSPPPPPPSLSPLSPLSLFALFRSTAKARTQGIRTDRKSDNHRPLCAWRLGEASPSRSKKIPSRAIQIVTLT